MSDDRTLAEMEADPKVREMLRRISVADCFTFDAVYAAFIGEQTGPRIPKDDSSVG